MIAGYALTVESADAGGRGDRDTALRVRDVEPEQAWLRQATTPLHAPPMPRLAETEARRPHPLVRRRACQNSLREHSGGSVEIEDILRGLRDTYGEERLPQRVMFGELVGGKGYSGGQEKDWMVCLEEDMSAFGI